MSIKKLLLSTFLFTSFVWSDALYTDTYMKHLKKYNTLIDTGIKNHVSAERLRSGKYNHIIRFDPIYFDGKEVTEASKSTLENILSMIEQSGSSYYVSVIGHTSDYVETGHEIELNAWSGFWQNLGGRELTKEESIALANERIKTVYSFLRNNNVDPAVMYTENRLGKDKISTEATSEGLAKNNRVDVALYLKKNINLSINFKLDSDIIVSGYNKRVRAFVKFLKDNPQYRALIIGHTDKQGAYSYNMDLSKRRADAVKKLMVSMDISEDRIRTTGKGYTKPLDNRSTQDAFRKNRRIEAKLIRH